MSQEVELERLVVRLAADTSNYVKDVKGAIQINKDLEAEAKRLTAAENELAAVMQRGAAVTLAHENATERQVRKSQELHAMLKVGAISTETHARAVKRLAVEYDEATGGAERAKEAQQAAALVEKQATEAAREHAAVMQRGVEITRSVENATERYNREMKEHRTLADQGAISQETLNRVVKITEDRFQAAGGKLAGFNTNLQAVGMHALQVGGALSAGITAPLAGIGYAARSEFGAFQAELAEMTGLVGVSDADLEIYKKHILELSGPVAKGPRELAEAMKFITGGGVEGADALEALEITAKAATAGLGEVNTVADAVTSAMNAYGAENLNATRATDILVEAVRLGKAEASQFAPVMGQIMPLAQSMGVQFEEVAGILAFFTRTTGNASLASTQLVNLMGWLNKGGGEAKKKMEELGISSKELSKVIREQGLVAGLHMLTDALAANGKEVRDLINDKESLIAALQLVGPEAATAAEIIRDVADSAGATEEAFQAVGHTAKYNMNRAIAESKVLLVELGEIIAPLMGELINLSRSALGIWRDLPYEVKQTAAAFAALLIPVGPTLLAFGSMAFSVTSLITLYNSLSLSLTTFTATTKGAVIVTTALGAGIFVVATAGILKMAQAIYNANTHIKAYNKAVEEGIKLQEEWTAIIGKKTGSIIEEAAGMPKADKKTFLQAQIEQTNKDITDYNRNIEKAKASLVDPAKMFELHAAAGGGHKGDAAIAMHKKEMARFVLETEEARNLIVERRKILFGALHEMDAADEAAAKKKEAEAAAAAVPAIEKGIDTTNLVKLHESLEAQIALFGKTGREAEIAKLVLEGFTAQQLKTVEGMSRVLDAKEKQAALDKKAKDDQTALTQSVETFTRQLEEQVAAFGKTATEAEFARLATKGVSEEQLKAARTAADQLKVMEKSHKMMERGKQLTEQFKDPNQKLIEAQTELRDLWIEGVIGVDVYDKALQDLEKQTKQEYKVEFQVGGIDAVAAGSAEAMARIAEYQNLAAAPVSMRRSAAAVQSTSGQDKLVSGMLAQDDVRSVEQSQAATASSDEAVLTDIRGGIDKLVEVTIQGLDKPGAEFQFLTAGLAER